MSDKIKLRIQASQEVHFDETIMVPKSIAENFRQVIEDKDDTAINMLLMEYADMTDPTDAEQFEIGNVSVQIIHPDGKWEEL